MFCINFFHKNTQVVNSRAYKKKPAIWRRRRCPDCKQIFTTVERPSLANGVNVWREDGSKTAFNLGKLIISISAAFSHDSERGKIQALELAQTAEDILASDYPLITTGDIEAVVHQVLKRFDELAAVQYAARHGLIVSAKRRGRPSIVSPAQPTRQSPSR